VIHGYGLIVRCYNFRGRRSAYSPKKDQPLIGFRKIGIEKGIHMKLMDGIRTVFKGPYVLVGLVFMIISSFEFSFHVWESSAFELQFLYGLYSLAGIILIGIICGIVFYFMFKTQSPQENLVNFLNGLKWGITGAAALAFICGLLLNSDPSTIIGPSF
jgi:hypothetical protein